MTPREKVVQLQKQLSIAVKVLKRFRDGDNYTSVWSEANDALDEIDQIQNLKIGMK